jgi:hypothetical protein
MCQKDRPLNTLKLNTYIFTPLLGEGELCPNKAIFKKGMTLEAKKPGIGP